MNTTRGFTLPLILAIIAGVIIVGGLGWWLGSQHATPSVSEQATSTPATPTDTQTPSTAPAQNGRAQTYANAQYGFSVQYPTGTQINTAPTAQHSYTANINNGMQVAVIGPIKEGLQLTESDWGNNGYITSDGTVLLSASTDAADVKNCMVAPSGAEISPVNITTKTINGVGFLSYEVDEPAAGLMSWDHIYLTLHNGTCYSIDAHIDGGESSHMNAADGAANDASVAKLAAELDAIATTFNFGSNSAAISVSSMTQYTDSNFGFSFWYPSGWAVTKESTPSPWVQTEGGTVVAVLDVGKGNAEVKVEEFNSINSTITDTGGAGPFLPVKYFFDATKHAWMTAWPEGLSNGTSPATTTLDEFSNTIGGLHRLDGVSRFDTVIIPLSAHNFVIVSDGGGVNAGYLAQTLTATDLSVATPMSPSEQEAAIKAEQNAYAGN